MPRFTNTNGHDIYVRDPDFTLSPERLHPVAPGQTVEASGGFADNLENTNGVYPHDSDEAAAARARYPLGDAATPNHEGFLPEADVDTALNAAKIAGTVEPLQQATGDPAAPRGLNPGEKGRVRDIPHPATIGDHSARLHDGPDVIEREHREEEHKGTAAQFPESVRDNRDLARSSLGESVEADDGLHERNLDELRDLAREQGREGYSKLSKADLITLLRSERPGDADADRESNE